MKKFLIIIFLLFSQTAGAVELLPYSEANRPKLKDVTLHAFIENSGELTDDISNGASWNFQLIMPDNNSQSSKKFDNERFDTMLIKIKFTAPKETSFNEKNFGKVLITGFDASKVLLKQNINEIYIDNNGTTIKTVLIQDVGCAGEIKVKVSTPTKTIVKTFNAKCGE